MVQTIADSFGLYLTFPSSRPITFQSHERSHPVPRPLRSIASVSSDLGSSRLVSSHLHQRPIPNDSSPLASSPDETYSFLNSNSSPKTPLVPVNAGLEKAARKIRGIGYPSSWSTADASSDPDGEPPSFPEPSLVDPTSDPDRRACHFLNLTASSTSKGTCSNNIGTRLRTASTVADDENPVRVHIIVVIVSSVWMGFGAKFNNRPSGSVL
jgi:hypothetical protein